MHHISSCAIFRNRRSDPLSRKKILVLGASGMLGHVLVDTLSKNISLDITATVRRPEFKMQFSSQIPSVHWKSLNLDQASIINNFFENVGESDWVINAIGLIKQSIIDSSKDCVDQALCMNAHFPHALARICEKNKTRILHVSTDCVFSGQKGHSIESHEPDALDVYGRTKYLGEVNHPRFHTIRSSLIGRSLHSKTGLLDWFLNLNRGEKIKGYGNHIWNGLSTLHFSKICLGIILNETPLPNILHLIPGSEISKLELLNMFAHHFNRTDVLVEPFSTETACDRTLATENPQLNREIWRNAGYEQVPSIATMVREFAEFATQKSLTSPFDTKE